MSQYKKQSYESTREIVDQNGHTITKTSEKTKYVSREPDYIKLYLDNILYLKDLPKGMNTVLYGLLKRMGYDNQLVLNAALKRQIAEEIGMTVKSIDNSIAKFVKGEILLRKDRGLYTVNPHLFGRGEWRNISEIRMEIIFNKDGKTVMTEIEREVPEVEAVKINANLERESEKIEHFA